MTVPIRIALGLIISVGGFITTAPATEPRQAAAIHALIQELDYLIEHAETLQHRYRADAAPIRFNYPALIGQLQYTRDQAAVYLNEVIHTVHPAPPPRQTGDLRVIRE